MQRVLFWVALPTLVVLALVAFPLYSSFLSLDTNRIRTISKRLVLREKLRNAMELGDRRVFQ